MRDPIGRAWAHHELSRRLEQEVAAMLRRGELPRQEPPPDPFGAARRRARQIVSVVERWPDARRTTIKGRLAVRAANARLCGDARQLAIMAGLIEVVGAYQRTGYDGQRARARATQAALLTMLGRSLARGVR